MTTDYTEKARNICRPSYSGAVRVYDAQHVEDVAAALREAHGAGRREGLERAADIVTLHTISYGNTNVLRPRLDGDRNGLEYATAILAEAGAGR